MDIWVAVFVIDYNEWQVVKVLGYEEHIVDAMTHRKEQENQEYFNDCIYFFAELVTTEVDYELCPLCGKHMNAHTVFTREISTKPTVLKQVGWHCPEN
jgi:hypothetical protein